MINFKSITEKFFYVYNPIQTPRINPVIKTEIGISDKLDFIFEIFQNKFHLSDCILGKITFNKVNFPIKCIEIHLYKKEAFTSI